MELHASPPLETQPPLDGIAAVVGYYVLYGKNPQEASGESKDFEEEEEKKKKRSNDNDGSSSSGVVFPDADFMCSGLLVGVLGWLVGVS
ncbi:uncharacterized protein A4U43_C03F31200 [Asparagus officinalis]|uniref:Uncharacterized protein n=1 Tax=Asparagus officinalis TaxID=4686 RepID=A0A5P1FIH2_ASPOF|nr:uncharacterized protein A4U43_C03F31200 [Asparagus officinalis]